MTCHEFQTHLGPYVDGELGVPDTAAADAHRVECRGCRRLAERERQFRHLLRRQPRERAPAEFRARIVLASRRAARRAVLARWVVPTALVAAAAVAAAVTVPGRVGPMAVAPLAGELVDEHITYAQIDRPAELASASRGEVARWFVERATLHVPVPDYSSAGIRLVGARIVNVRDRKAAYVLYEKGRTLLSVFMLPRGGEPPEVEGTGVTYHGNVYLIQERKGHRTVVWSDGHAVFGLVSLLDYDALLECADRLRADRAARTRL